MFQWLNKKIKSGIKPRLYQSQKGQVAVVIIFVIGLSLMFYAVSLNLGRIAEKKTVVTVASNVGASQLASLMASYGHQLSHSTPLEGERKRCFSTSVLEAIIRLVIFVVLLVVSIFIPPLGAILFALGPWMVALTVALMAANIALDALVIQPGISGMWNKVSKAVLTQEDQFTEAGIRAALHV